MRLRRGPFSARKGIYETEHDAGGIAEKPWMQQDKAYFVAHPDVLAYTRDPIAGEFEPWGCRPEPGFRVRVLRFEGAGEICRTVRRHDLRFIRNISRPEDALRRWEPALYFFRWLHHTTRYQVAPESRYGALGSPLAVGLTPDELAEVAAVLAKESRNE